MDPNRQLEIGIVNKFWFLKTSLKAIGLGSAIRIGKSIFAYPGFGNDVQRIDLTSEEEIESIEIIGTHSENYIFPILLPTSNACQQ